MRKEKLNDIKLLSIKLCSSPIVSAIASVIAYLLWVGGLYIVTVLIALLVVLMQYGQVIVIREERRREREIVFNSLKSALIEEFTRDELDN